MIYTVAILNFTALGSNEWKTPHEVCFGETPDISALLHHTFYQPIYYSEKESFPQSNEKRDIG